MIRCRCHVVILASLFISGACKAPAPGAGSCPPVIAGLVPKSGADVRGGSQAMGFMGKGSVVAGAAVREVFANLKKASFGQQASGT